MEENPDLQGWLDEVIADASWGWLALNGSESQRMFSAPVFACMSLHAALLWLESDESFPEIGRRSIDIEFVFDGTVGVEAFVTFEGADLDGTARHGAVLGCASRWLTPDELDALEADVPNWIVNNLPSYDPHQT